MDEQTRKALALQILKKQKKLKRVTQDDVDQFLVLRARGETVQRIADLTGFSRMTVDRHLGRVLGNYTSREEVVA